jgi:hypothetical protein
MTELSWTRDWLDYYPGSRWDAQPLTFEQFGTGRSVLAWRCLFLVSRFSVGLVPSNQSVLGDGLTGV